MTSATPDSGRRITGGGSGYAALLAHGMSSVRYGIRLGDLKNKQPKHTESNKPFIRFGVPKVFLRIARKSILFEQRT